MKNEYSLSLVPKLIYVMRINDKAHSGCLKVGDATVDGNMMANGDLFRPSSNLLNQAAKKRINSYTQTAGIEYELLYTEITIHQKGNRVVAFRDYDVHQVLERSGIKKKLFDTQAKADEWFVTDLETVKRAIAAVKAGRQSLNSSEISQDRSPIVFRPEQKAAIEKTKKQFKKNKQMLWYAKMRFGKTLSALQVVKDMEYTRTLILTHRPAVNDGWFDDFHKIFYDRDDFAYGSKLKGESFVNLEKSVAKGKHYVYFASMQDLRGSEIAGGKFDKNNELFSANWDLIIVDEAHEGTKTDLGQNVLKELTKDETRVLHLSGTPFNLLDEYQEDEIYTWDYVMEQKAKADWFIHHPGDHNPYEALPRLNIYTFDLGKEFKAYADEDVAFNFHEFFRVGRDGEFIHKSDVARFLNLICKLDNASNYPYSTEENRDNFRHSFWRVPGVREAKALSALLQAHPVFGQFKIVNVAGDGDDDAESEAALKLVKDAIGPNPEETYTITLSCGRLTTGVSVPAWTAVFMLAGSFNTSASSYMQTIFRCQTPATINGKVKTECFVFDFAPDRTLKVIAETAKVAAKVGKTTDDDRKAVGEFLNFCPVISMSGTRMAKYDVDQMLEQLKKAYVERVVRNGFEDGYLYNNDALMKLDGVQVEEFNALKKIIGQTKAMPKSGDIDINNQGFTNEEYEQVEEAESKKRKGHELTEEEKRLLEEKKEKKKLRNTAVSILRGISIRMPLMLYGAELSSEDQEITIDNFTELIDPQSWEEFMPKGVSKQKFNAFKKYYEPDVFRAAGKRIRAMARAADGLPIEERIERITAIFNTFRNPDKETVLTPWRVVNMHMNDCLGSYVFYDEKFERPLAEPRFVDRGTDTKEVFDIESRVLEINSKTGLYPLYVAYSIYRNRLKDPFNMEGPDPDIDGQYRLWMKTVAENIFIISKTKMAKSITRRTLLGFRDGKVNAHCFDDLINMLKNKSQLFVDKVSRSNYWGLKGNENMKFDAIVGNPPYQEETAKQESKSNGQAPRTSVFQYFQMAADQISSGVISLIYPGARWIHRSGKGMAQFGLKQINATTLKRIDFYPKSQEIFKDVAIADGLSIVFKDVRKKEAGFVYAYHDNGLVTTVNMAPPGENLIPLNPQNESIVDKVTEFVKKRSLSFLHKRILPRNLFGIESNFVEENPTLVREFTEESAVKYPAEIKLFTNDKAGKAGRARWYIASSNVIAKENRHYISEWQVVVSSANAGGQKRDNQISIIDNHSAFGRSRVALGSFKTSDEAKNFYAYAQTTLIKFMFLMTDESLTSLGKKVPDLLDYSAANKLIDFSQDLDTQLYELVGLTPNEISFIESTIKPME